jgi:hypothetical protein
VSVTAVGKAKWGDRHVHVFENCQTEVECREKGRPVEVRQQRDERTSAGIKRDTGHEFPLFCRGTRADGSLVVGQGKAKLISVARTLDPPRRLPRACTSANSMAINTATMAITTSVHGFFPPKTQKVHFRPSFF